VRSVISDVSSMIHRSRFYFLSFFLSYFFLTSNGLFAGQRCAEILSQISHNQEIHESKFVKAFRSSQSLLIFNRAPRKVGTAKGAFIASNEYDVFKVPAVLPQRDLFVGIGNNASWDLALRSGARKLLMFDINYEPLMMQRYFFRTLFEISESPVDFYRYLFLIPSEEVQHLRSFKDLAEYDWNLFLKNKEASVQRVGSYVSSRKEVIQEIYAKIKQKSVDPEKKIVLEFLKVFYREPFTQSSALFQFAMNSSLMEIQRSFRMRYFPPYVQDYFQLPKGSLEKLYQKNPTFISDVQNFHRMKHLMLTADYIQLPLKSPIWEYVARVASGQVNGVTVFSSNIIETNLSSKSKEELRHDFKQSLTEHFSKFLKPVFYVETFGNDAHHEYEYVELPRAP
jgi:hypothetical protein